MGLIEVPEAYRFLYEGRARYRAAYGGRGTAKSHQFATAALLRGTQRPMRILCCREIQNSIRDSVKRLLDDKIQTIPGLSRHYTSVDTEIRGRNDTLFVFTGLRNNIDSVKSKEGFDLAWVEEANTVSQRSLDLLIPTIRKDGAEIWATWNPRYAKDPIDAMFRGPGAETRNAIVKEIFWTDNPWFPAPLREEMRWDRMRDRDKYEHVWLGKYLRNSEARVFRNWRVEHFDTPPDVRFYFGADWGFSVDPTVLVRCWIRGRTLYVDREVHAIHCEIDKIPGLFERLPGAKKWPIRADSARPETISYVKNRGFNIAPATKGEGSVEDGIEFLKNYDIVVHPSCVHAIDELSMYSWKTDRLTGEVLPILEDKNNHVIDALRYALELVRKSSMNVSRGAVGALQELGVRR